MLQCGTQIGLGLGDPWIGDMPQLEYVVKDLKRFHRLAAGRAQLPITPELLQWLRSVWARCPEGEDASMLWAAACMCLFGFLRAGEVVILSDSSFNSSVHLAHGDVRVDSVVQPQYLEVTIKSSKTDPFCRGGGPSTLGLHQQICVQWQPSWNTWCDVANPLAPSPLQTGTV